MAQSSTLRYDATTQKILNEFNDKNHNPDNFRNHWPFGEPYLPHELQTLSESMQSHNALPLQFQLAKTGKQEYLSKFRPKPSKNVRL